MKKEGIKGFGLMKKYGGIIAKKTLPVIQGATKYVKDHVPSFNNKNENSTKDEQKEDNKDEGNKNEEDNKEDNKDEENKKDDNKNEMDKKEE